VLYDTHRYYYTEFVPTHALLLTEFQVYPNPASSAVTIKGVGLSQAMIFDQHGRLVCTKSLLGQDQQTLQLGNLPSGNYFLQVLDCDGNLGAKPIQIRR